MNMEFNLYSNEIETLHSIKLKSFIDGLGIAKFPIRYKESYDHLSKKTKLHIIFDCCCRYKSSKNIKRLPMFEVRIYAPDGQDNAFKLIAVCVNRDLIESETTINFNDISNLVFKFNKLNGDHIFKYRNMPECVEILKFMILYIIHILKNADIVKIPSFNRNIEIIFKNKRKISNFDKDGWCKKLIEREILEVKSKKLRIFSTCDSDDEILG